ncbi:hypothetical protein ACLVWU_14640 [Bdellovibrio sp. HCB290]|uniref:hypothetical protein n=1 Tax=Bdellovibrio sp. HCB290 TaxID=3394356 RepID=UPI0039B395BA
MRVFSVLLIVSAFSVFAQAEEGTPPQPPFKNDYGQYSITGCAGQTFQLDCKLKSVTIGTARPESNPKGKGSSVGFVFKSDAEAIVNSDFWMTSDDKFEVEDQVSTLTTDKIKNTSNWSEEAHQITLDKSNKTEWTLTFAVTRDNLGKSIKRQIEFKIKKK